GPVPAGFRYFADFLGAEEAAELAERVRSLDFTHDRFRGRPLKRAYAQFGFAYVTTGRRLQAAPPFPDWLARLVARCLACCPRETAFEQCIVTRYSAGAGIGWHTDADCFGDCIAAVS